MKTEGWWWERMDRRWLPWIATGVPALLVGLFEFFRHHFLEHLLPGGWGNLAGAALVALTVYGFIRYFLGVVTRTEQELGRLRAEAAVLSERQRLAREMHDSVAQALFNLGVRLREVSGHAAGGTPARLQPELERLEAQVSDVYHQVRMVIADLRRQAESEEPGEALHRAARQAARALGLELQISLVDLPRLGARAQEHAAAILSEAMANAHRHGKASRVRVTGDRRQLCIEDDGCGFAPARQGEDGFGLVIMAERASLLGGDLRVWSEPGRGTRLVLRWEGGSDVPTAAHR